MDECPHCGEPIAPSAESCPHCGSDCETGWKPDTDYYAVELPEDDRHEYATRSEFQWESFATGLLLFLSGLAFIGCGLTAHEMRFLPFAGLLGASLWLFHYWLTSSSAARG
jgi:uncharacterized membrane protein YvbJ